MRCLGNIPSRRRHRGSKYKFQVRARDGRVLPQKADPYALQSELRPATASVVARMPSVPCRIPRRGRHANALDAPVSIYEVHLGSWRRKLDRFEAAVDGRLADLGRTLRATLLPYARDMGFTHLELLPVSEHPFDGSWGYQPVGLYAPTSRFGTSADEAAGRGSNAGFRRFVERMPLRGPRSAPRLGTSALPDRRRTASGEFDGTHLYEYADPREGFIRTGTR